MKVCSAFIIYDHEGYSNIIITYPPLKRSINISLAPIFQMFLSLFFSFAKRSFKMANLVDIN